MDSDIKEKSARQLLSESNPAASPNSPVYGKTKLAIYVKIAEDLEKAIKGLTKKVGILDFMLVIAAIIGGIATALIAYKTFFP